MHSYLFVGPKSLSNQITHLHTLVLTYEAEAQAPVWRALNPEQEKEQHLPLTAK